MKRTKNKQFQDIKAKKRFIHDLRRKDITHNPYKNGLFNHKDESNSKQEQATLYSDEKEKTKRIFPPKEFSFIFNKNESLAFFNNLFKLFDLKYNSIFIDMRKVENLTIEVLLYIISIDKINKKTKRLVNLKIKNPKKKELGILIDQSGLSNYFKCTKQIAFNEDNIFTIRDGETNRLKDIDDSITCSEAVDFALTFFKNKTMKDPVFRFLFNALAEMMTNTDNHAYSQDEELRNWYLFAVKVETGIAFYFFDNGKGILHTAKKNMIEKAASKFFSLGHESLMEAVLNGDYRSATGLPYRNKGLPEIKDFLINDNVSLPIILTDRLSCFPQDDIYDKNKYVFKGSLFIWILKFEDT